MIASKHVRHVKLSLGTGCFQQRLRRNNMYYCSKNHMGSEMELHSQFQATCFPFSSYRRQVSAHLAEVDLESVGVVCSWSGQTTDKSTSK